METKTASNRESVLKEEPNRQTATVPQSDEVMAWEPIGDDRWLPRRVRGSWRGGVLG
jgi:hypothetical protein